MSRQDELPIRKGEDKMLKKINAVSVCGAVAFFLHDRHSRLPGGREHPGGSDEPDRICGRRMHCQPGERHKKIGPRSLPTGGTYP